MALTVVASIAYAWAAFTAAYAPYWMDEVLAVWTARQPSIQAVWDALRQGAEFSPPLYHLLLRAILACGIADPIALRLPSIVAIYVVALAAYALVRRRFPRSIACLALVLCLSGLLFSYAIQVRQYALVAACFALACLLWDGPAQRRVSAARALGIAGLLSTAIGLHFYAVLLAGTLGLMELLWTLRHRQIRVAIVLAILASVLSILLWLPIMRAVSAYNLGDATAPGFYAKPTLDRLLVALIKVVVGDGTLPAVPLLALIVALVARLLAWRRAEAAMPDLTIVAFAACMIPLLIFAFSAIVTGTFNERYVIVSVLGVSLVVALYLAAHRRGTVLACCLLALSAGAIFSRVNARKPSRLDAAFDLLSTVPAGIPIVTGDGMRFLEFYEGAHPSVSKRLVFLKVPDLDLSPDPTNAHQVERWARINPSLPVRPMNDFLSETAEFLLFSDPKSSDILPDNLRILGYKRTLINERSGMRIDRVRRSSENPNLD